MAEQIKFVSAQRLGYYDEKIKGYIADADEALKDSLEGQVEVVAGALDAEILRAKGVESTNATSAENAQNAADAAQKTANDLKTYVGTFESENATTVVAYIDEKTANIASDATVNALAERVTQAETDIDNIEKDYLKASDKEELQGNIDTVSGAVERLTNGVSAEEVDGVNDLIAYVKEHGTEVTGMQEDISKNAEDIAGVAERMTTDEGKITAVEGAVATKAEKSYVDEAVEALEGADSAQVERIAALEEKFGDGEGSVTDLIADAKQEAIDSATATASGDATEKANKALEDAKKYADDEDAKIEARVDALETASATHALASDLTALTGRVTTAESEIDTLQGEMDAVQEWQANMVECETADIDALFA